MNKYKRLVLGGLLAGSLIGPTSPAIAQSWEFVNDRYTREDLMNDRREVRRDQRVLDRANEQLLLDREILDRHLRQGAHPRTIAQDRERVREGEARVRRAEAELRHDRRELAENYWEWRRDRDSRFD
ncbi:MAG TPA: hypothetical protein VGL70_18115 [Candidatus Binatia bacterium]